MVSIDIADVVTELEACRQHCLPGREMVEGAAVWWALHRLLTITDDSKSSGAALGQFVKSAESEAKAGVNWLTNG